MPPKASVLIINYNYGGYLAQAVESVLAQDFPSADTEIIIIDDGSTDDSHKRVAPYLDRVHWHSKPNGGQVSAFNAGFDLAKGEYIALLESDDTWKNKKLSQCITALQQTPEAALVQHWLEQTDANNAPLPGYTYPNGPTRFNLDDFLEGRLAFAGTSCIVFRKERLAPFLPLPETMFYGADICLRLVAATLGPLLNIPQILGTRRLHGANLFGESFYDDPQKLEKALSVHHVLSEFCQNHLKRQGMPLSENILERLNRDQDQMELFLHRYRGQFLLALRDWRDILGWCRPRSYAFFKGASLLMALVSPSLYLTLQKIYARMGFGKDK